MEQIYQDYLNFSVEEAAKKNGMTKPTLYAVIKKLGLPKKGCVQNSGRKSPLLRINRLEQYKLMCRECVDIYENNPGFSEIEAFLDPLLEHKFYLENAESYFEEDFNICKMVLASLKDQLSKWKRNKKAKGA
jgi:hypothetical protein